MKRFLRLSLNDFRMIFRDPMLKGLIGLPLLVILLAVSPSYWSFQSIEMLKNDGPFWFYHIIGWVVYFIFIAVLVKRFESKVF